jgi:hypothetical protein
VPYFDGPFFFALDELHLIGMGLCQHLFGLFAGNFDVAGAQKGPFSLNQSWKTTLGKDLDQARANINQEDFNGSFRFPWSKYTTRAVDWIDLVRFVVPALIIPSLTDYEAQNALLSLVRFVQRTQCRQLTEDDLQHMDGDLLIWNTYVERMQQANRIARGFVKPNHHYLTHVTEAIRHLGPLCSYSTRSMERSIGGLKQLTRSNKDSGANAMNVMMDLAALAYMDQRYGVGNDLRMSIDNNDLGDNPENDDVAEDDDGEEEDDDDDDDDDEEEEDDDDMDVGLEVLTRLGKSVITQLVRDHAGWPDEMRNVDYFPDTIVVIKNAVSTETRLVVLLGERENIY